MELESLTDREVLTLWAQALEVELAPASTTSYDATDAHGVRYQIKARRLTRQNGSRQLSFIRKLDEDPFDYLLVVLFDRINSSLSGGRACRSPVPRP